MSCSACTKKYGLFLREIGCGKCGFSFCKNCSKYVLPGLKRKVCQGCFNKASKPEEKAIVVSPPVSIEQPRAAEPPQEPVTDPSDLQLHNRLEQLKTRDGANTSQSVSDLQLNQRLAQLQDRPFVPEQPNRDIFRIDQRSEQEKVNDLVERYHNEVSLDQASDPITDLEQRLNKLRGTAGATGTSVRPVAPVGDPEDEDKQFVKRILAEALLDAQVNLNYTDEEKELMETIPKPPSNSGDLEELPWCTICNEDAKVRCLDCDGELYCKACFWEIHQDDEDYRSHKIKPYQKPKNKGELSSSDED